MIEALEAEYMGKMLVTFLVSMVPVMELRGGIPFGAALGLDPLSASIAAILGNLVPVPFIMLFVRHVFNWMRKYERTAALVDRFERKAHIKGETVKKYQNLGLCILVAIPFPGTGAWTGALVASFLEMRIRKALIPMITGVCIAAFIVSCVTWGIAALL